MQIKKMDDKPMVIHTKDKMKLHTVESKTMAAGHMVTQTVTNQVEGGEEVSQAAAIGMTITSPITGTVSKGSHMAKEYLVERRKQKLKVVQQGKKKSKQSVKRVAKNTAKKTAKGTAKKAAKETAKETTKAVVKETAKVATNVAASAAGTAISPGVGTAIGIAAGYAAGAVIEEQDMRMTNRGRKLKFFLDKLNAEDKQKDSFAKLVKDLLVRRITAWIRIKGPIIALVLGSMILSIITIAAPIAGVIAIIYNSPFAIFFPPTQSGDTVMSVTSRYVSEFQQEVNTLVEEHTDYDEGMAVYIDYEGSAAEPTNYHDILAVYMVKYGVKNMATVINDTSKTNIRGVVEDMCSYTTRADTRIIEDGEQAGEEMTVLCVEIHLKSYHDMIDLYGFNEDEVDLLKSMMNPEMLAYLSGAGSGGGEVFSSLSQSEMDEILSGISDSTQKKVCRFALLKVGYPYSQSYRDSGDYFDCSSLAYYAWKEAGVDISYGGAYSAAEEARGLETAQKTVGFAELRPGDLIFYSFCNNGRYKNISHVAIYVGNGKVVEAKSEQYGVVYGDIPSPNCIVVIGRP